MDIIEDIFLVLLGLVGVALLITATSATVSLLGVGCLLLLVAYHVRTIARQARLQTEALIVIAEGQDA